MRKCILLLALPALIFAGCVKQKNCEGCIPGKFIYLETPLNAGDIDYPSLNGEDNGEIVAKFYSDDSENPILLHLVNPVPQKVRSHDTIKVCLSYSVASSHPNGLGPSTCKLTCIEKID